MRHLNNFIVILFCWSLGLVLYGKTQDHFASDKAKFSNPNHTKIFAHIQLEDEQQPSAPQSSSSHFALLTNSVFQELVLFSDVRFFEFCASFIKKSYLFVTSGLSPPQLV